MTECRTAEEKNFYAMKLKHILALIIFFANLLAIYMNYLSHELSRNIIITERQRILYRVNQIMLYLLIGMVLVYLYMVVIHL